MTSAPTDAELVVRAQHGELDAYEELVRRYQGLVVRVAFLITRDLADAEDVAQEALLKAYSHVESVRSESFRPWLLRITANEARNARKAARRHAGALARASSSFGPAGPSLSPEMAVLADEQRTALLYALEELREEDRVAISYRYLFNLSESEMVEALGWPQGTVKSRLSRALGRLRQQVGMLAVVPPTTLIAPEVARELAGWSDAQLEHGLGSLAAHFSALPVHDLSTTLLPRLHALAATGHHSGTGLHWWQGLGVAVAAVAVIGVAVAAQQASGPRPLQQPVATLPPPATSAPTAPVAPVAPVATVAPVARPSAPPVPRTVVVYGGDLSAQARSEIDSLFGAPADALQETVGRDEVLSTLAAAGMPSTPDTQALSSVRLDCPSQDGSLDVRSQNITMLPTLTYATALLAAGTNQASVFVAAPTASPVTGEAALVSMLRAAGQCSGNQAQASSRVSLGYLILQLTSELSQATGDWPAASTMLAETVQAVVTGQARDEAGIAAALDAASARAGQSLQPDLRAELASRLTPLVGQDYGQFARGYRIDLPASDEARLIP